MVVQNSLMTSQSQSRHEADREIRITELAGRVGIGVSHMSLIMSGKRMPSLPVAVKIAKEMGVTVDELCVRLSEKIVEAEVVTA